MKFVGISFAAGLAGTIMLAAPAVAQVRHVEVSHASTTTTVHDDHHVYSHHPRHKVCKTQWHNHHKVRNCRWTR